MTAPVLSLELTQQLEVLRGLLQRAVWLAERCADYEATQVLHARLTNLQSAALLVIVGEVKAGKSSFLNALVREDICEVAPGPCTTAIREIVYGPERAAVSLGQSWDRVYLPKEVLRELSIVDTPGTNSIIRDHQTITENYVPQSDLVVFVFSAVNPHTKSAWEFLNLIRKDWRRKTVFVLQQSDRASERELTINREHVRQYASERQVDDPMVFMLSAKRELECGNDNGFAEFRNYLSQAVARGEVWRMKVEGSYETIRTVVTKLLAHLRDEQAALAEERNFYADLLRRVEEREARAASLKQGIFDRISATYDDLAKRSEDEFVGSLGLTNLFKRAVLFLPDPERQAAARLRESARKQIAAEGLQVLRELSAEIQTMMTELNHHLAQRQDSLRQNALLPQGAQGFRTLADLRTKLERIRLGDEVANNDEEKSEVARLTFAGGGLAAVGILLTLLSPERWLEVTGVVLASLGILLLALGLLWRRSDMLRNFRLKLVDSRKQFHARLDAEFADAFDGLFYEVRQALSEAILRLELQSSHLTPVLDETFRVGETASDLLLDFQRDLAARPA